MGCYRGKTFQVISTLTCLSFSRMVSCTTVASRFWPLRSSGLRLTLPPRYAAPCWRAGVNDCKASWKRNHFPSFPWTALMGRRVTSWSRRSMRNMPPRSLGRRWGSTWGDHYHPTTRWKLECEDSGASFIGCQACFNCMMEKIKGWLKYSDLVLLGA